MIRQRNVCSTNDNAQAVIPISMVLDLRQFNGDKTKFEDWWREIILFLKSNRVLEINDRIMVILACLRRDIAGIYVQKKLDELDEELRTQNQNKFIKEIKTTFSNKMKIADAEQKIKSFKQGKQNTADFMIKFKALAIKADTDELHNIFLLKKNVQQDIIKMILEYLPIMALETLKE